MLDFGKIYMVRHGSYSHSPQKLTAIGKAESEGAGQELLSAGVKPEAILLSSDAPRALQTSEIIGSIIGATVIPSKRLNIIGNNPRGVESLDIMIESSLAEADTNIEQDSDTLVVVAHQPLLQIAAFGAFVANGQVIEYQPQSWQNPEFNNQERVYLSKQLEAAGLAEV